MKYVAALLQVAQRRSSSLVLRPWSFVLRPSETLSFGLWEGSGSRRTEGEGLFLARFSADAAVSSRLFNGAIQKVERGFVGNRRHGGRIGESHQLIVFRRVRVPLRQ